MQALKIILLIIMVIYILVYIMLILCGLKPIRTLALFSLLGVLSLTAVNLTTKITGVGVPLNPWTLSISAAGGIPATIALLLMQTIMGL